MINNRRVNVRRTKLTDFFQGLFIFIIYVVGNSEVRSAVKRLQEKHTLSRSVGERSFALKSVAKVNFIVF